MINPFDPSHRGLNRPAASPVGRASGLAMSTPKGSPLIHGHFATIWVGDAGDHHRVQPRRRERPPHDDAFAPTERPRMFQTRSAGIAEALDWPPLLVEPPITGIADPPGSPSLRRANWPMSVRVTASSWA